jgi:hypothetical protein
MKTRSNQDSFKGLQVNNKNDGILDKKKLK